MDITAYVNVTGFDLAAIYITAVLAFMAGCVNLYLATRGPHRAQPVLAAVATLGFFYSAAYVVLLAGPWSQADWSKSIRIASWLVWSLVWMYVPIRFSKLAREIAARSAIRKVEVAETLVAKVAEAIGVEVD